MLRALCASLALALACCASPPPPAPQASPVPELPASGAPSSAPTVVLQVASAAPVPPPAASATASAALPQASPGSFRTLTRDEAQRLVVPHLAGAILAHAPMIGPFGPSSEAIVAITTTAEAPPAEFGGFVLLPDGKVLKLPPFHEHWSGWELVAAFFEDEGPGPARELVILAQYITGAGPQAAVPFFSNAVVRWDGNAFVRVPAEEKRLARATSEAEARRALRKPGRGR